MTIFGSSLLIALAGTAIYFGSKSTSGRAMVWTRIS